MILYTHPKQAESDGMYEDGAMDPGGDKHIYGDPGQVLPISLRI
jgi:hypothetical protein